MATLAHTPTAATSARSPAVATTRLQSIDALRGLVMLIMLLDHVRETWLLYVPLGDPVDARTVMPALFFTRITSTLCAPIFVALTGLSAYLYSQRHTPGETSRFLLSRGAFLVFLEFTFVNFSWRAEFPPNFIFLQVIWAIGLCMIVLAGLIHLPRKAVLILGIVIVAGHNLLDGIVLPPDHPLFVPWGIVHERSQIELAGVIVKFNYPILPWIGVICLGWSAGSWFSNLTPVQRRRTLLTSGTAMIAGFVLLRALNIYGDAPWFTVPGEPIRTVISFLALTKYPPSLLFLLLTLGVGLVLLALFEQANDARVTHWLSVMGGAPMFFYLLHLYLLRVFYLAARATWGTNHGDVFGVDSLVWVWVWCLGLIVPLYFPTRWFSDLKKRRKDIWWLKYL
jgi:Predicted membrane protein